MLEIFKYNKMSINIIDQTIRQAFHVSTTTTIYAKYCKKKPKPAKNDKNWKFIQLFKNKSGVTLILWIDWLQNKQKISYK